MANSRGFYEGLTYFLPLDQSVVWWKANLWAKELVRWASRTRISIVGDFLRHTLIYHNVDTRSFPRLCWHRYLHLFRSLCFKHRMHAPGMQITSTSNPIEDSAKTPSRWDCRTQGNRHLLWCRHPQPCCTCLPASMQPKSSILLYPSCWSTSSSSHLCSPQ